MRGQLHVKKRGQFTRNLQFKTAFATLRISPGFFQAKKIRSLKCLLPLTIAISPKLLERISNF